MVSNAAKAAHRGDGSDLRNSHSGRGDVSENSAKPINVNQQYRLVATVAKSAREQFRVGVRDYGGVAKCELRIFELDGERNWKPTPRAVVIGLGAIAGIISALCECEARL